jgi:beta-glucosidase/6-phospho-beta-glucosidase/beta-galactosidase
VVVNDAVARVIDLRGLFHWTAVDNYERLQAMTWPSGSSTPIAR